MASDCGHRGGVSSSTRPVDLLACLAGLAPCLIRARLRHRARQLIALGHQVRLVPPSDVKACFKRGKNDAADAEAICEAVTRPSMRFVPEKRRAAPTPTCQ